VCVCVFVCVCVLTSDLTQNPFLTAVVCMLGSGPPLLFDLNAH